MVKKERQQRRGRNRNKNRDIQQQENLQQKDIEAALPPEKVDGQTSGGQQEQNGGSIDQYRDQTSDQGMNGNSIGRDERDVVQKKQSVTFSLSEHECNDENKEELKVKEEQEEKSEDALERIMERKRAFKGIEDFDPKELREEETEKIRNSTTFGLIQKVFAFFFPAAIKRFVSTSIQCIGGVLISTTVIGYFFYLFYYFGQCDQQVIETSEIPENMIYCQERLLAQQIALQIDVNGTWSNEEGYNARRGGPWQISFKAYQATEDIFEDSTDYLLNKSANFIANMEQRPFFDILEQAFFLKDGLSVGTGSAVLGNNIDLETIFDNYDFTGFKVVDLKKGIQSNFKTYSNARLNSSWDLLPGYSICSEETQSLYEFSFQNHWICGSRPDYDNTKTADLWIDGMRVRTILYEFYPIIMEYMYPGSNFNKSHREPQQPFKIEWDFAQLFGYDYCNNAGKKMCYGLLNESKSLESGGPQAYKDFPYFSVSDFIDVLNHKKTLTLNDHYDAQVAERTVYINSLQQFGFFAGKDYIAKPQGYKSNDSGILSEDGKTVEFIIVPQLTLATPSLQQTTVLGQTYYVCESCLERKRFLDLKNFDQDSISGICKKSAYLYLHVYAYAFNLNLSSSGITVISQEFSVENNYVTTLLYRLDGIDQQTSFFTKNYKNKRSLYYYNTQLAELQELHCNASEWAFQDDLNITVPFTLTTGIFSCEVEYCLGLLERFGNAQANVQLLYLGILLFIVTAFICAILPKARTKDPHKKENFQDMLFESIAGAAEGMA